MCEYTLSIINFMKSKYTSCISNENLTSKLQCAISANVHWNSKMQYKKTIKSFINNLYTDYMLVCHIFNYQDKVYYLN